MPIRYYGGVEGSGKTCMMTRDLLFHYKAGGRVLAFPGYELFGSNKHQILSELIFPEQLLMLLKTAQDGTLRKLKIAIAIDEVSNFFNNHTWWNAICDIMQTILAQRRKLGIAVEMTGPEVRKMPPDLREMVHEIVFCMDYHTLNHAIPRGEKCIYQKQDLRGLLSHPNHRFSRKKIFFMKDMYKHYDTYAAVDMWHRQVSVKIKKPEIIIGPDGVPLNEDSGSLSRDESAYIDNKIIIAAKVAELRKESIEKLEPREFYAMVESMGLPPSYTTKRAFAARGLFYDTKSQCYRIAQ